MHEAVLVLCRVGFLLLFFSGCSHFALIMKAMLLPPLNYFLSVWINGWVWVLVEEISAEHVSEIVEPGDKLCDSCISLGYFPFCSHFTCSQLDQTQLWLPLNFPSLLYVKHYLPCMNCDNTDNVIILDNSVLICTLNCQCLVSFCVPFKLKFPDVNPFFFSNENIWFLVIVEMALLLLKQCDVIALQGILLSQSIQNMLL